MQQCSSHMFTYPVKSTQNNSVRVKYDLRRRCTKNINNTWSLNVERACLLSIDNQLSTITQSPAGDHVDNLRFNVQTSHFTLQALDHQKHERPGNQEQRTCEC